MNSPSWFTPRARYSPLDSQLGLLSIPEPRQSAQKTSRDMYAIGQIGSNTDEKMSAMDWWNRALIFRTFHASANDS